MRGSEKHKRSRSYQFFAPDPAVRSGLPIEPYLFYHPNREMKLQTLQDRTSLLGLFADPTRVRLLAVLEAAELSVGELTL